MFVTAVCVLFLICIRLLSQVLLLTYFLAVWSTAELRLKNQGTEYIENKKTQNETSKEHARLWRRKGGLLLCWQKMELERKIGGDFATNEEQLQYSEPGPFKCD